MHIFTREDILTLSEQRGFTKQAQKALSFAYELMSCPHGQRSVHHSVLYDATGRQNKPIGAYFSTFFTRSGSYQPGVKSFTYSVQAERLPILEAHARGQPVARCNHTPPTFSDVMASKGRTFLTRPPARDQLPRTGDRVYPWWATMKSKWRRKLFLEQHPVLFDYDVSNAKPTLLLHAYDKLKGWREGQLPTWRAYVKDKQSIRQKLMDDMGWDKDRTKSALQAICNGAWVAKEGALASEWDLAKNETYLGLREDFQEMWVVLERMRREGETQGQCLSREYLHLEDIVMDCVSQILDPDEWIWWIHDGWMTKTPVRTDLIEREVKQKTGMDIQIEEDKYTREDNTGGEREGDTI